LPKETLTKVVTYFQHLITLTQWKDKNLTFKMYWCQQGWDPCNTVACHYRCECTYW